MSFYYAQDKDAFKDIDDLRFRNMPTFAQAMAMKQPSGIVAVPNRKAMYRTDANGNPIQLTDEEIALRNNAAKGLQQQAAAEAATPAGGNKWYEFLKNPQNTPYEQKQMRNQEIMRDAAIGSMLMKPIFNPDADISEGMVRMAGQQQGMAQSAMDNYLKRQGMAADMYNSATKLATNYAAQSLQSQIQAQQELSAAENYEREAAIRAEQAEKLFGKNSPAYISVVKSKDLAKQQELANQYDAMMRDAKYLKSEAQKRKERSEQFIGKAKAFGDGAKKISQDWELGLNFEGLGGITPIGNNGTQVGGFAKQGETGINVGGPFVQFPNTGAAAQGTPSTGVLPTGATEVPVAPQAASTGAGNASTGAPEKPVYTFKNGKLNKAGGNVKQGGSGDPIMKRIAKVSTGRDVDIAEWKRLGARIDPDTGFQAAADKNAWLTELQAVTNDIVSKPENFAKYKDFVYKVIEGGDRFGNASNILMNSTMNIPKFKGLRNYETDIMTYGGENSREELQDYYSILKGGGALTGAEVKNFEKLLSSPMFSWTNYQGKSMPLLKNNGLKLKAVEARNPDGSIVKDEKGNTMYFINLDDSFK